MATEKAVITQSHLTDIANAIIAKGGATGPLKPSEMKAAIEAIPTGGYKSEWDWRNDGNMHIWVEVTQAVQMREVDYWFTATKANAFEIDWGDGSNKEFIIRTGVFDDNSHLKHRYTKKGVYEIVVSQISGNEGEDIAPQKNHGYSADLFSNGNGGSNNHKHPRIIAVELSNFTGRTNYTNIGVAGGVGLKYFRQFCDNTPRFGFGDYKFYCCYSLAEMWVSNGITGMGDATFSRASCIDYMHIPATMTSLLDLNMVVTIEMESSTPPSITTSTFSSSRLGRIIVPKGSLATYQSADNWAQYADRMVEAE